jgi:asparagine synthase (glutamine-hydrolysing)
MSSIVGIYSVQGEKANKKNIERMLNLEHDKIYDSFETYENSNKIAMGQALIFTTPYQENQLINYKFGPNEYSIVFNGRIDNRDELFRKVDLPKDPKISDAELIVHLYHRFSKNFLSLIEGDFALGIWDSVHDLLIIARDPLGMRNLFYSYEDDSLIWGTELKQILYCKDKFTLNKEYLYNFLLEQPTNTELTPYLNIFRVEPGQAIFLEKGTLYKETYYIFTPLNIAYSSELSYIEHFSELFQLSVENRLITNQSSVGISLSGGLDSTSIAATAIKLINNNKIQKRIKSYSLVFNNFQEADEREYISLFIKEKNLDSKYILGDEAWLFKNSFNIIKDLDEPYPLFTYCLSSLIPNQLQKEGINVLIDGHIGDHVLFGDLNYLALLAKRMSLLSLFNEYKKWTRVGYSLKELLYKNTIVPLFIRKFSEVALPWIRTYAIEKTNFPRQKTRKKNINIWDHEGNKDYFETIIRRSDVEWVNQYIPNKFGIEVRHPFLDKRLMEFLAGIPVNLKIQPDETKYILRKSMSSILPEKILQRSNKASHASIINMGIKKEWHNINNFIHFPILSDLGWINSEIIKDFFEKWYLGYSPNFKYFTGMLRALSLEIWLQNKVL